MTKPYWKRIEDDAEECSRRATEKYYEIMQQNKEKGIELTDDEAMALYLDLYWGKDSDEAVQDGFCF